MPSSKDKGNGKGSPQKQAAARRIHTRITNKSNKQARIEETQFDTLAALSSPKPKPRSKKQLQRSESTTSPLLKVGKETPERRKSIPQVVTLPKKKQAPTEESSDDSNSTVDENASVTKKQASSSEENALNTGNSTRDASVTMANLPATAVFDPKFEHLLTTYVRAIGDQHDIRQAFIQSQIFDFEGFIDSCTLEFLQNMQLKKGDTTGDALNKAKLKLVNDALLYHGFLYLDNKQAKADDPTQWIKQDFRLWKIRGYHKSTAAYNASLAVNTTAGAATVTTTATAAAVKQKEEDDSLLSWRRSRKDEKDYPVLESDRIFYDWSVKFERKIRTEEMYRMIDPGFYIVSLHAGSDTDLFHRQKNHFSSVLDHVLQTSEGKRLTRKYPDDPRKVWNLHEAHSQSSATTSSICTGLSQELAKMKIVDYNTPTKGLDTFDSSYSIQQDFSD